VPANNGVLVTNGSGVPSISTTLPNGLAMGTPDSITLMNGTGLPISTGVSGLGTGVATTLGLPVNGSGSLCLTTSCAMTTPNIGMATGTSLELGSFAPVMTFGNQSGSTLPYIGWAFERASGQLSSDMHGIWPSSNTLALYGISELASSANDPGGAVAGQGPRFSSIIDTSTTTSVLDSVAFGAVNVGNANGANVVGQNIVVGQNVGVTGGRLTGLEIDIQSAPGATATYSDGLQIQAFHNQYDWGQRITGASGGSFNIGYDFSQGTFNTAAIKLGNDNNINKQRIIMDGAGGTPGEIYVDTSNLLNVISPGALILQASNVQLGNGGGSTNFIQADQTTAGNSPFLRVVGNSDANVNFNIGSVGSGAVNFYTGLPGSPVAQVQVIHTASANRTILLTGSNGGNPTISTSAGALAITPAIVAGSDVTATGTVRANTGFSANGTAGASATVTVRDSAGTGTCNLVFTSGLFTSTTC
jgi:hypothetical protein